MLSMLIKKGMGNSHILSGFNKMVIQSTIGIFIKINIVRIRVTLLRVKIVCEGISVEWDMENMTIKSMPFLHGESKN